MNPGISQYLLNQGFKKQSLTKMEESIERNYSYN
jgi:hypothetical protein